MVLKKSDPDCATAASDILEAGGVLILPCDTIYGIVGAFPRTGERIRQIKGREEGKDFLVLIPSAVKLDKLSPDKLDGSLLSLWPGPLTMIVRALNSVGGGRPTIALRLPDDPFLVELMERTGLCLFSTSVNRSGHPALWSIDTIIAEFGNEVDLVVDAGDLPGALPSTILDTTRRPFTVLRQGACIIPDSILRDGA